MFYKHQYFNIDIKGKKVFDENNKRLRLTGNAYRLLVFLCKNEHADITEIGLRIMMKTILGSINTK